MGPQAHATALSISNTGRHSKYRKPSRPVPGPAASPPGPGAKGSKSLSPCHPVKARGLARSHATRGSGERSTMRQGRRGGAARQPLARWVTPDSNRTPARRRGGRGRRPADMNCCMHFRNCVRCLLHPRQQKWFAQ